MTIVPPRDGARATFAALADLAQCHALSATALGVLADLLGRVDDAGKLPGVTLADWAQVLGMDRRALAATVNALAERDLVAAHFPRGHAGQITVSGDAAHLIRASDAKRPAATQVSPRSAMPPAGPPTRTTSAIRPGNSLGGHTRDLRLVSAASGLQAPLVPYADTTSAKRPARTDVRQTSSMPPGGIGAPKERAGEEPSPQTPKPDVLQRLCAQLPAEASAALRMPHNVGSRRRVVQMLENLPADGDIDRALTAVTRDLPDQVRNWPGLLLARIGDVLADPSMLTDQLSADPAALEIDAARAFGRHQARQILGGIWDENAARQEIAYRYRFGSTTAFDAAIEAMEQAVAPDANAAEIPAEAFG